MPISRNLGIDAIVSCVVSRIHPQSIFSSNILEIQDGRVHRLRIVDMTNLPARPGLWLLLRHENYDGPLYASPGSVRLVVPGPSEKFFIYNFPQLYGETESKQEENALRDDVCENSPPTNNQIVCSPMPRTICSEQQQHYLSPAVYNTGRGMNYSTRSNRSVNENMMTTPRYIPERHSLVGGYSNSAVEELKDAFTEALTISGSVGSKIGCLHVEIQLMLQRVRNLENAIGVTTPSPVPTVRNQNSMRNSPQERYGNTNTSFNRVD